MSITLTANGGIFFESTSPYPSTNIGADFSSYRNRISNGNMVLSQRTVSNVTTHPSGTTDNTVKHFAADRFRFYSYFLSASNVTNYQRINEIVAPLTPEGHKSCIKIETLTNTVVASTDYCGIMTGIEGSDFYDSFFGGVYGVPFVLSFWAKSTVAGHYCVSFRNYPFNRSYVTHYTLETNTWTKVYIPLPPCGDSTWNRNADWSLLIFWALASGSDFNVPSGSESVWVSGNYLRNQYQTNFINQTAGQSFNLTGVCLERAPASALSSYVLRNTSISVNGTTGLTLLENGNFDDWGFAVSLPFNIKMFGKTSNILYLSSNGYLGVHEAAVGSGATGWGTIPSALDPSTIGLPHVGFFKGDKRLLTLYGGSRTINQQDGSSLSAYVLRWEGYNYGGDPSVKTIVEFTFYQDTETYEGFNYFDVYYTTNSNGTTYLELNPGYNNSGTVYPYAREIVSGTLAYRCYTKAFSAVQGTSVTSSPGAWWNISNLPAYNYSYTTTSLSDAKQYRLGVSSGTSKLDSGIDYLRCLRYFEKTTDESYVIPPTGNGVTLNAGFGVYYRFKTPSTSTSYIPLQYSLKRTAPSITLFSYTDGIRGQVTLDGSGGPNVTGHVFNAADNACMTRVDYNVANSHYGYYCTAAIDSDI